MKHYNYIEDTNALEVIMVEVPENEPYFPYYDGLAQKKAKLMGKKLAGGSFTEDSDMLKRFLEQGGKVYKIRKGTKPLMYKKDGRLATPIMSWDEYKITEHELEFRKSDYADKNLTDEGIREEIYQDYIFWENVREDFLQRLTDLMKEVNKSEYWKAEGTNMGWRHRTGYKVFQATEANDLLHSIMPDTDCTLQIYRYPKGFKIINYHHDAPTGERYIVKAISERTYGIDH